MQWKAIYNKETGFIRCTVAASGELKLPDNEAVLDCSPEITGLTHKVDVETLQFVELPKQQQTIEEIQEQIDALLAKKAELEK